MPGSFKDFNNNGLFNVAVHPCSTDDGRGIPAVGKMVFRTDDSTLYVCTDTSPNAGEVGGGTWTPVGGGGSTWQTDFGATLTAPYGTDPDLGADGFINCRYLHVPNELLVARYHIVLAGTGLSEGSGQWYVSLPVTCAGGDIGKGRLYQVATPQQIGFTAISTGVSSFYMDADGSGATTVPVGGGASYGPWTWAQDDFITITVTAEPLE